MPFLTPERADPNPPDFPYYTCEKCSFFHRTGKECTGKPKYCRLGYDGCRALYILAKRQWRELHAEWREVKPEVKAEFEAGVRELCKEVEAYMKDGKDDNKGVDGGGSGGMKEMEKRDGVMG